MYWHEYEERKPNAKPMCTELPAQTVDLKHELAAHNYLTERNLDKALARFNGWYVSTEAGDRYTRIVIPAVTHKAGHAYWQARDVTGKAFIRYQSPEGPRHEALVRVETKDTPKGVLIVEGPMDALAGAGEGYLSYALMGMQPSKATLMHLALLVEDNRCQNVLVLLDRDSAQHATAVSTFLCSQGYFAQSNCLPGPEKDLAQCQPQKREVFLGQSFQSLSKSRSSALRLKCGKSA